MATTVCMNILEEIRSSNLNFEISETPYSAYISLRKRFVKEFVPNSKSSLLSQSVENETLKKEIAEVLAKLEDSETNYTLAQDTIAILETRVQKAESRSFEIMKNSKAALDDKNEEIKVLKGVIKKNADETVRLKNENENLSKGSKAQQKEIYNLENKNENQGQTIKNQKESLNILKAEKKKLDRKSNKSKDSDANSNCIENNVEETTAKPP